MKHESFFSTNQNIYGRGNFKNKENIYHFYRKILNCDIFRQLKPSKKTNSVRHRARLLIELIQDDELLRTERRKAKIDGKEKYLGYSKEDMCFGKATYGRPIFAIFFIISKINCFL